MIAPKYDGFADRDDVARQFEEGVGERWNDKAAYQPAEGFPTDRQILYAGYVQESYEGSAFVLFTKARKLYEVNASHCSCYGLEGQWTPEETTWAALAIRPVGYQMPQAVADEAQRRVKKGK